MLTARSRTQPSPSRYVRRRGRGAATTIVLLAALLSALSVACTPRERAGSSGATPASKGAAGAAIAESAATLRPTVPPTPPVRGVSVLVLHFAGLRPLASGHYEGWAIFGGERISTGKFSVNPEGTLTSLGGTAIAAFPLTRDIVSAQRIAISIEPDGDRDATPSGVTILEGALVNGRAELAFTVPLAGLGGGFTLMTPTDTDGTNDGAGVWYFDLSLRSGALTLTELPPGWVFEGWVGTQGLTFSTGRFTRSFAADLAAPFSGTRAGPAAPGEDLVARLPGTVRTPVNLADGASSVAITIEPNLGGQDPTGLAPFWLLMLRAQIPQGAPTLQLLPLELDTSTVPAGVATVG